MTSFSSTERNFIEKASECARSMVIRWICSVFRQVSLLVLRQCWIASPSHGCIVKLTVTHAHLDACERTCQRLATLWIQRLRDAGQMQVAGWIQQVVQRKHFWESHDSVLINNDVSSSEVNPRPCEITPEPPREDGSIEEAPTDVAQSSVSDGKLIMTRMRQLFEHDVSREHPKLQRTLADLDQLGKSGESAWPYSWQIIQEASLMNARRLHSETIKGHPLANKKTPTYEVVPKSIVMVTEQEQSAGALQMDGHEVQLQKDVDVLISTKNKKLVQSFERKRKATSEPATASHRESLQSLKDPPRPPSSVAATERWSWQDDVLGSFSQDARQEMERTLLHPSETETGQQESLLLMGALKDVGYFHRYSQEVAYGPALQDDENITNQRRHRRQVQKAKKQRLYPHVVTKDDTSDRQRQRDWTKVLRTADDRKQQWLELDLGECLMEVSTDNGDKTWCAFSSLEVMLQDKYDGSIAIQP